MDSNLKRILAAVADLDVRPPKRVYLLNEIRTGPIALALAVRWRALPRSAAGNNEPVLLLPGFLASEVSLLPLSRYLRDNHFRTHQWQLGRNTGDVPATLPRVIDRVKSLADRYGRPVHLVGQSLGGYLAREAARDCPDEVAQVVTLGTPAWGGAKYTITARWYERQAVELSKTESVIFERFRRPIQQPLTIFYSKRDAIVSWRACVDHWSPRTEHVEISQPHLAMCISRTTLPMIRTSLLKNLNGAQHG